MCAYITLEIAAADSAAIISNDSSNIRPSVTCYCSLNAEVHNNTIVFSEKSYIVALGSNCQIFYNLTVSAEYACECTDRRPFNAVKVDIVHQNVIAVKVIVDSLKLFCCGDGSVGLPIGGIGKGEVVYFNLRCLLSVLSECGEIRQLYRSSAHALVVFVNGHIARCERSAACRPYCV